jgi:methylmalonyl-CoA/ethylmalonyl-CoA epimerase
MTDIQKINHVAVVVKNLENALEFWEGQLGLKLEKIETVESMSVRIAFLPVGDSEIELVEPTAEETGTARFLRERGPGMHHLCLEVADLPVKLEDLKDKGVHLIHEVPEEMEDGRLLAFIHPRSTGGVLLELYQLPEENI